MARKSTKQSKLRGLLTSPPVFEHHTILVVATVSVLVGVYIVARLLAAGLSGFEAEGNLTGTVALKADSSASGGQYIQFGTTNGGTTTPPPPPPVQPPPPPPPSNGGNGVGGSGANMTPGRKCAAGTSGAQTISSGDLGGAINSLGSGGTLVVNGGTYGAVSINNKSNITVCGAPGTRPVINSGGGIGVYITGGSEVHFEGFEIKGTQGAGDGGVEISGDANHIHIWDTWVHDMGSVGIGVNAACGHMDLRYNRMWNTSYYDGYAQSGMTTYEPRDCGNNTPDAGIYTDFIIGNMGWHNGELSGNDSDGNCIIWDDTNDRQGYNSQAGPYHGRVLIANNVCAGNGGRGVHIFWSAHADVVNNTDYFNINPAFHLNIDGSGGQMDASDSNDVRFINNVSIARPGRNAFDVYIGSGIIKSNNIFNQVSRDDSGGGGYQTISDPGFTSPNEDPTIANFRPRAGSPLINAGIGSYANVIIPNVDFTGKTRGSSPSIGAYEP